MNVCARYDACDSVQTELLVHDNCERALDMFQSRSPIQLIKLLHGINGMHACDRISSSMH